MKDQLLALKQEFVQAAKEAASLVDLEQLELRFLGRKSGRLTELMKGLKKLSKDQIAEVGQLANEIKTHIEETLGALRQNLGRTDQSGAFFDLTLPGTEPESGHLHLVTEAIREIAAIFQTIGFRRVRYPEVEWDYYAFEALNMPSDHPARDEWETFFVDKSPIDQKLGLPRRSGAKTGQRVLTPHTSSGQIREMEKTRLPIRMMNISKTYRRQIDASHSPMFHQFEGLVVDRDINITHLKGTIDYFVKNFFGPDREIRLRPHHFKFTEPSFEVDVSCGICGGAGCKLCKDGWLELAGAGMVHENVLRAGGIDPDMYSGFAFGWGVERCYLMKSGLNIDDIRLLYKNDLRFLKQF